MSDEFLDWLDSCPRRWFLVSDDGDGTATYTFNEHDDYIDDAIEDEKLEEEDE